jgi:hypothetical protein
LTISWESTRFTIANNVWSYYGQRPECSSKGQIAQVHY